MNSSQGSPQRPMNKTFNSLLAINSRLAKKGFVGLSHWWLETLRAFYQGGKRQLVIRCGRRGGKSSSLCRVAVAEAIGGEHDIPKGDIGVVAIVSVSRDEAAQRLRTIKAILDAMGLEHRPCDGGVELVSKPIAFKVFAASVSGVSGFTAICVICDELAKWRDGDQGLNPATEVLASVRPTMATQPNARIFLSSSCVTNADAHARAFDEGSTAFQSIAIASTWLAHPALTEAACRALEPDPKLFAREYACVPSSSISSALDADDIVRCVRDMDPSATFEGRPSLIIDSSRGNDGWSYCIARWRVEAGVRRIWIDQLGCYEKGFAQHTSFDDIVSNLATLARRAGAMQVFGDQYLSYSLDSAFGKHGLAFKEFVWSLSSKIESTNILSTTAGRSA